MLKRKILARFKEFFSDSCHAALLVTGARQVGKTYSIRQFGKENYSSFVEINFIKEPSALAIFQNVSDAEDVLRRLSIYANGKLISGKTLVFFDEVQKCPEVVTYIKFLVERGGFHYILSGSLLGVELKNVRSFPVGYMDEVEMYPLDFEEFICANNFSEEAWKSVEESFRQGHPIDSFIHERLMRYYRLYLVVGGMPAAVQQYIDSNDLMRVVREQTMIRTEYLRDISQYDESEILKIRAIYERLASELASENKRFIVGSVSTGSHFSRIEDGFLWLCKAGIAIASYCLTAPQTPLVISQKRNIFKLFANDVGILASMYMQGLQLRILNGETALNIGAVYENAVAQELRAHGIPPNYFNSKKQGELDFVVELDGYAVPLEIKSGKDYKRHSALDNVLKNSSYEIERAYVFNNDNIQTDGKIIYAPIYTVAFLNATNMPDSLIYKLD